MPRFSERPGATPCSGIHPGLPLLAQRPEPSIYTELDALIQEINRLGASLETEHEVILYDDNEHTIDDVIRVVHLATGCTLRRAYEITMEVHEQGQAIAYRGTRDKCEQVSTLFAKVELKFEIR